VHNLITPKGFVGYMEDLESAIYSLKEAITEHFGIDDGHLASLVPDNIHETLLKLAPSLKQLGPLRDNVEELMLAVELLRETMDKIVKIQDRALKWQEMSQ